MYILITHASGMDVDGAIEKQEKTEKEEQRNNKKTRVNYDLICFI